MLFKPNSTLPIGAYLGFFVLLLATTGLYWHMRTQVEESISQNTQLAGVAQTHQYYLGQINTQLGLSLKTNPKSITLKMPSGRQKTLKLHQWNRLEVENSWDNATQAIYEIKPYLGYIHDPLKGSRYEMDCVTRLSKENTIIHQATFKIVKSVPLLAKQ